MRFPRKSEVNRPMSLAESAIKFDKSHIWHPYTNLANPTPVFKVESASGVYLNLDCGTQLIDGMSSWWSAIHGYNHPQLNQAVNDQAARMSHVMFGGLTHEPAVTLSRKLIDMTDEKLDCVFLADSGSIAVEVALKMALQYWIASNKKEKKRFLTIKNGYHGDTFGAMSVCDPDNGMHALFGDCLLQNLFVDGPTAKNSDEWSIGQIEAFQQAIEENHLQIAAVILEPIVQGAGGMKVYCPEFLREVRKLCDKYNVLLILDEIATGFGRTGTLFAYEQAQVVPDILCLGKALTGGYLSLAATITTRQVADVISSYDGGSLMHGPTFMGNPLACAVAVASLSILESGEWAAQVAAIEKQLEAELRPAESFAGVKEVRVKGAIGVIELESPLDLHQIHPRLKELGVWLRPFGKLLYTMPPYIISKTELSKVSKAMVTIAKETV